MEDKSPSFCRLCNMALASPSVWRQHAKSDWHVYNLRVRVAEPGTVVLPPSASPSTERGVDAESNTHLDDESDDESDDGDTELSAEPEFKSQQCLFCGAENGTFDDNLAHMSKAHSFTIPYQDYLTVDLETLVGYLHLVIHGYGECILCAARRSTVEGIQHHMTAKGHCRFNVASDIAEFYEIPASGYHADEESLRLPSGKLLSHRTRAAGPAASRTARQSVERRPEPTTLPLATPTQESELVPTQDNNATAASCTQLSRLTRGDQQNLAHLPDHEVRSLLATGVRHIDQSRREEKRAQLKLEKAGNTTLTAHFRADTSKRFRGPWG
ncbi:Zinc finger protein [Tolypocladium ophioglossoides CBS 100239]|uniref:Zinc finger protein n=1 Tax=Tolypocladium ophioglossoides (strain CBS 100239) TaxID=1163406 RepID=A0A0L0NFT1_TOLOC|nr:Zinc finger protein [Tolypocladium ophioglossoides CBS 100239]